MKLSWYAVIVAGVVVAAAGSVVMLVTSDAVGEPATRELVAAKRSIPAAPGTSDERDPIEDNEVSGPGVVLPLGDELRLSANVPGRIARIAVVVGSKVQAGDVIAELDGAMERAVVAAAAADVEAATAKLRRALGGSRAEEVIAADAEAATARARAELSKGVFDRTAAAGTAVTGDELDRTRKQAEIDAAAARAAEARRAAVVAGPQRQDLELLRAEVAAAKARAEQATAAAHRLIVRSPIAGEVLDVRFREGEYYAPGAEPLAVLGDTSKRIVRMDVDERDLGQLRVGQRARVTANAYAGAEWQGTVVRLGRRMGSKRLRSDEPGERADTRVLSIEIELDAGTELVIGQRVTCRLGGT